MLEESRYNALVAAAFKRLLAAFDAVDPDLLEADTTPDMVTLTSTNGQKCIINTQRAVRQIWVAGKGQGIHFNYDDPSGRWMDDKSKGIELFQFVAEAAQDISGITLEI